MSVKIHGCFQRTIYRNEKDGFTVFAISTLEGGDKTKNGEVICSGKIPTYPQHILLELVGEWSEKEKYGDTLELVKVKETIYDKDLGVNFLSKYASGLGEVLARKVIEYTGDIFSYIERADAIDDLAENIESLSIERARGLVMDLRNISCRKNIYELISEYGYGYNVVDKLIMKCGYKVLDLFKSNPYEVGAKSGIDFITCDTIALNNQFSIVNEFRMEAIIREVINRGLSDGHTCFTTEMLKDYIIKIQKKSPYKEVLKPLCFIYYINGTFDMEKDSDGQLIYSIKKFKEYEEKIVEDIKRLINSKVKFSFDKKIIKKIEKTKGKGNGTFKYGDGQIEAFNILNDSGVKIVTGGPGCGKTTFIDGLIDAYTDMFPNNKISLCAPTGQAAKRIHESTGRDALTIHKLIEYKPFDDDNGDCKNSDDPLDADMIIVDEMSMVGTKLMSLLVNAIQNGKLLVLVGDPDQLLSVDVGSVFKDFINSGIIDVYELNTIYRQKEESLTISNAGKIKNGITSLDTDENFQIKRANDLEELIKITEEEMDKYYSTEDIFKTQILSTIKNRKYEAGVHRLNDVFERKYNKNSVGIEYNNTCYKVGDKVVFVSNNYELGYVNGDFGIITGFDGNIIEINLYGDTVYIEPAYYDDIMLAYVTTVHKSQGSEYDIVIVVLPLKPVVMLKRNLLYTAITRNKEKIIIISEKDALERAIECTDADKRKTLLRERLMRAFGVAA